MASRADTSSGRFGGQWAFLSTPTHQGQARSLPPSSSYLRSDRSNVSPLSNALHINQLNASRSSLPRNGPAPSVGDTSTTIPSQPVLLRVHSDTASIQIHPTNRSTKRARDMSREELPPIQEYSIQSILAAVREEIEDDVNAISEILGRSRLVLADQHDSQLPPQGEIRASSNHLQSVAEASSSNERLATDDVIILAEDASLVNGSLTGSAAYRVLERSQAHPRTREPAGEISAQSASTPETGSLHNGPAPTELLVLQVPDHVAYHGQPLTPRRLLRDQGAGQETSLTTTDAVVSETYLSAAANAMAVSELEPPTRSESGRQYPLYSFDESNLFEGSLLVAPPTRTTIRERLQSFVSANDLTSLLSWVNGRNQRVVTAEAQLREILNRQPHSTGQDNDNDVQEETDLYQE
ncbi:hypothetical protein EDD37DRAFT_501316 [Exophiala viscosa]|uniref:uncharacterized protein n=1 Tax=Exophiala viscosa TaxID=2486360 RepID=UPI0021967B1D|nr:hypothetical protein EDD37DRAFT_501316 [Exophiala viscosa]